VKEEDFLKLHESLERYSQKVKNKNSHSGFNDTDKLEKFKKSMQEIVERSKMTLDGVKESKFDLKSSVKNAEFARQIPYKVSKMITPAKNIEFIISLYPNPLRTLHTIFQLEIEGAT
jgi:uncharacterized radical SAM superfamily protein